MEYLAGRATRIDLGLLVAVHPFIELPNITGTRTGERGPTLWNTG